MTVFWPQTPLSQLFIRLTLLVPLKTTIRNWRIKLMKNTVPCKDYYIQQ